MDGSNKSQLATFNLVPITENDELAVLTFLRKYFLTDAPLQKSLKVIEENATVIKFEKSCAPCFCNGISMMAISETGDILGVRLNRLMYRDDANCTYHYKDCDDTPKYKEWMTICGKVWQEVDVFGRYPNVDRVFELKCVAVKHAYRGQGICKALYCRTKEIALKLKCQMMYVMCTSYFSAKTAEKLGFQCLYSLFHLDYVNKQGQVVCKLEPPHEYIKDDITTFKFKATGGIVKKRQ